MGMLKSSPEFRRFVLQHWRSRHIFNDALNLVMSQSHLDNLSRLGKLNAIYQCGLSSEFQDIHVEQQAHADFLALTVSHRRGGPRQVPQSWSLAITYLKAKFQPHIVFSLPNLLHNLLLEAPREGEVDTTLVCPWTKIMQASTCASKLFNHADTSETTFFEVINAVPEKRHNVVLHHLDLWTDTVHVARRALMSHDVPSGRVLLLSESSSQEVLHLRVFMNELGGLPDLYMWELIRHGIGQAVRRHPQPVLEDSEGVLPMLLPQASSTLAVRVDHGAANRELVKHTVDLVAVNIMADIDRAAEANGTPDVSFSQLSHCHMDQIIALAQDGALRFWENDFGEIIISKNADGTRYVNIQNVGKPLQVIKHDSYSPTSK